MLHFTRLKALGIILTTLLVCAFAIPNFFAEQTVKAWPQWAQRHIVLGLDLRGGVSILLEVDTNEVRKDKVNQLREDVLRVARENRLGGAPTIRGNTVEFRTRQGVDPALALQKMRELSQPMGGVLSTTGQRNLDVVDAGNGMAGLSGRHGRERNQRAEHDGEHRGQEGQAARGGPVLDLGAIHPKGLRRFVGRG